MKMIMLALMFALLLAAPAAALDGEVYFGAFDSNYSQLAAYPGDPGYTGKFVSGIELGHKMWGWLRPYVSIEVIMDQAVEEMYAFHPASDRYTAGIEMALDFIQPGVYLKLEHQCWHPVDRAPGYGTDKVQQYNLAQIGWKFGQDKK